MFIDCCLLLAPQVLDVEVRPDLASLQGVNAENFRGLDSLGLRLQVMRVW